MIRFFAGHRTAANLLMLLFVAVGVLGVPELRRETFPELPVNTIEIRVPYPGAAPGDVEDAICRRIEDAVDGVESIFEVRSQALESLGKVTVEIVEGADVQVVLDDLRTEVEAIDDFPEQAERVVIRQLGLQQDVASIAVVGELPLPDLKARCEQLKEGLLRLPDVEVVEVLGFSDHQLRVEVSALTLMQYGLSAQDIARSIEGQSIDLPAGSLRGQDGEVVVRFTDQRRSVAELAELVVVAGRRGGELHLGEIARITDTFELDEEKYVFDGRRAGLLAVRKTRAQDMLDVVRTVKAFIAAEKEVQPAGTDLFLTQDRSSIVQDRLQMLVTNGWQGLLLVFATLWLFFSLRLSFWVTMGLPVAFLGALFLMTRIDYSLNMLTMVALLLALGLLMDDAIVIAENVATHLAAGKTSLQAAIHGVNEVKAGVLSSFATTVAVFGPLAFLRGDLGAVLKVLPVVLILVLAVSLVEAFWIMPNHLAHSLQHFDPARRPRFRRWFEARLDAIREGVVGRLVDWCLRWRGLTLGLTVMLFLLAAGILGGGFVKFQAFPDVEGDVIEARVLLPQGTPLQRTEEVVAEIVAAFDRVNDEFRPLERDGQELLRHVSVRYNFNADAHESGPHVATVTVDLLGAENREAALDAVTNRWREEVGRQADVISLKFAEPVIGPAGLPIEIRLQGDDLAACGRAADAVRDWFLQYRGVFDVAHDLRPGKPEVQVQMREGAASLGLQGQVVAQQLRTAVHGETASDVQVGAESYEVEVLLAAADRDSVADLERFHVTLSGGAQVPVETVATLRSGRGYARIARVNRQRTVTVEGNIDPLLANIAEIMREFQRTEVKRLGEAAPGVRVAIEGESRSSEVTGKSLQRALLLGLLGVFVLLSFQFRSYVEPLVVMAAIPLCLIGVVGGHLLMGINLSMPSMVGFVSLAGVVVNDSILLVEFLKRHRDAGMSLEQAAGQASRLRFRAILLTSLTTIAGMVPLLTEQSPQAQVLIPLVTSIVFGLLTSTVLVLFVVPVLYLTLQGRGSR